jgi:hypothetical protein
MKRKNKKSIELDFNIDKKVALSMIQSRLQNINKNAVNDPEIIEAIVSLIASSNLDVKKLFLATLGVYPEESQYTANDEVYVALGHIETWNIARELMEEKGLIIKDMVKATVEEYNKYTEQYTITYEYLYYAEDNPLKTNTIEISSKAIKGLVEDYPVNLGVI